MALAPLQHACAPLSGWVALAMALAPLQHACAPLSGWMALAPLQHACAPLSGWMALAPLRQACAALAHEHPSFAAVCLGSTLRMSIYRSAAAGLRGAPLSGWSSVVRGGVPALHS